MDCVAIPKWPGRSEYSFNNQLGYISLNQALNNDEVLAVAFQYTIGSENYQVGEFSATGPTAPDALILKLLKGTKFSPSLPNWDLMMKNIYAIGAYQMSRDNFVLDVVYDNSEDNTNLDVSAYNLEEVDANVEAVLSNNSYNNNKEFYQKIRK